MANTLQVINPIWQYSSLPGTMPWLRGDAQKTGTENFFKETAGQTYTVGDLVYLDSNGTVALCTNSSNNLNSAIAGQAETPATGVTGAPVLIRAIRRDDIFRMSVWHSTAASAVLALTQLGVVYRVRYDTAALVAGTGGKWVVDIENTTIEDTTHALGKVQVVGFYQGEVFTNDSPSKSVQPSVNSGAFTDIYGQVLVKFIDFTIETDGGNIVRNLQFG